MAIGTLFLVDFDQGKFSYKNISWCLPLMPELPLVPTLPPPPHRIPSVVTVSGSLFLANYGQGEGVNDKISPSVLPLGTKLPLVLILCFPRPSSSYLEFWVGGAAL